MRKVVICILVGCMTAMPVVATGADKADADKAAQLLKDVDFCYGVSALAASTVQLRNQGQTQEAQLERRKASLSEGEYTLVADITAQVYEKDLRDPFVVAGDTNADCLRARNLERSFNRAGQKQCPKIGLMKAEVDGMRRRGTSADETIAALKDRYKGTRTALGETLETIARAEPKGDQPDSGAFENQMCMILAMSAQ